MRIRSAGKITKGLWFLGCEESGIYLLEGSSSSVMISGGMSWIISDVLSQMRMFGIDESRIDRFLILHAHFDHLGVVPFFKRRLPQLEVLASEQAWRILENAGAIDTINRFSRDTAVRLGKAAVLGEYDLEWRESISGRVVHERDVLDCGNMTLKILETPGHSSCSISAYEPTIKALFPSDSGGIPFKETIICSGNSDYTLFQQSLEKLNTLEVNFMCADHGGFVTGDEARGFIGEAVEAARDFRSLIERVYRRTGSIEATVSRLVSFAIAARPDYFLTPSLLEGVYRQMVTHISAQLP